MKKCLACMMMLAISFQLMYPAVFTAWFYANRAAIASKYCVNKKRPMLHCDGQCYLAKKIQAAEQEDTKAENAALRHVWVESTPCILHETDFVASAINNHLIVYPIYSETKGSDVFTDGVFRPPVVVVA